MKQNKSENELTYFKNKIESIETEIIELNKKHIDVLNKCEKILSNIDNIKYKLHEIDNLLYQIKWRIT